MSSSSNTFVDAARAVFSNWTALNLAINGQWGGPNSADKGLEMLSYCLRVFQASDRVYADELEDYFEGYFIENFNTELEDGSYRQVADLLIEVHKECQTGNLDKIRALVGTNSAAVAQSQRENESDDDVSGDEEGDLDMSDGPAQPEQPEQPAQPPQPRRVVDEDGWETVTTRKGRR